MQRPAASPRGLGQRLVSILASARSDDDAGSAVLAEVARDLKSSLAVLWAFDDGTGLLHWRTDWADGDDVDPLREVVRRLSFAPGVGLPGRALACGELTCIEDIATDRNFPRADVTLAAGLRSAVGVPLVSSHGVLGVMEFLSREPAALTGDQIERLSLAGTQLATYLVHQRIEDRLRATEEASASIVQAALDCIITMDHEGRIVDFNPAAEATFGYSREDTIGEVLAELIVPPEFRRPHRRALERYVQERTPTILGRRLEMVAQRADGSDFPIELTVTRLGTREPPRFAGFIRDITERRAAEENLSALLEREQAERARATEAERAAREVAQALQHSLLPPGLPPVAGLDLGAAYRAGTEGWEVGGDFYDVFKLGLGRWAVTIGDVCGKGPRAAALTGRVRYALRLAAVRDGSPSAVLAAVNEELLLDGTKDFFTAIFATVDLRGGRTDVRMAVGGHPLPLLVGRDGTVTSVGRPGPLLGAVESVVLHDEEFSLGEETLLLYTDGLTEARTSDGRFGDSRLAALLASAARLGPQELVDRTASSVLAARSAGAGDDIAMLAVSPSTSSPSPPSARRHRQAQVG